MPIQTGDIKLLESDTMEDTPQGGGAMTGRVIVDGVSNNIFDDISTLDRVYGAVHMRKVFPAVQVQATDKYFGSHVILSKLPGDEQIGVNLFNTGDWFDRRPEAQSRVENYLAKGSAYSGFLWATQWRDSKVITIFQGLDSSRPGIGDVLYLTNATGTEFQYVRITNFGEGVQVFTDADGEFSRNIVTLEISQPLEYDFVGSEISRYDNLSPDATIKNTALANAAKYYSARALSEAGADGDYTVKVDSVYSQVIPSSQQEFAILGADMNGLTYPIVNSSDGSVAVVISQTFSANATFYLGSPCVPGTLSIPVGGGTIFDSGGTLKIGATSIGTIKYSTGVISFSSDSPTYTGTKTATFRPAGAPTKISDTVSLEVTAANRGYIWSTTITPPPLPGSVQVSFMALGEWYTMSDDGSGGIKALESGIGSGGVDYATGVASVTLAALPDVGSSIIFISGKNSRYFNRSAEAPETLKAEILLTQIPVIPATLVLTWNDGVARTASADANGIITGDGVGRIEHNTGQLSFALNAADSASVTATYSYGTATLKSQTFSSPALTGTVATLALSDTNITPGSVEVAWNVKPSPTLYALELKHALVEVEATLTAKDDGSGGLKKGAVTAMPTSSITYATGALILDTAHDLGLKRPIITRLTQGLHRSQLYNKARFSLASGTWDERHPYAITGYTPIIAEGYSPNDGSGSVTVTYRTSSANLSQQDTFGVTGSRTQLNTNADEAVTPGSVRFSIGSTVYIDRSGRLYSDIDPATNAGIDSGSIDYATSMVTIASVPTGESATIDIQSLMTEGAKEALPEVSFRIPNAPVKVDSVQLSIQMEDGTNVTATPSSTGHIDSPYMQGWCDYSTGIIVVEFGSYQVAAGNEGEDWYAAHLVDPDGNIFVSARAWADTMTYNATSQTFLPLDAAILGLDPVRLPQDGRIPIYAPGDLVVVLHDQITAGTFSNGQQTDLGRTRLAKLSVRDAANQLLLETRYTANLDTGIIDWIDLSGVSQPVTVTDRVEDMALLTDVQITGTLSLSRSLTHTFPANETLVSNAVIYGDLFAHTTIPFDQQVWTGEWSDMLIGSETAAQYNNSQYPITVDDASCIQERWHLLFSDANTVNVVGENVGQILTGASILADIAPVNPNTSMPYFTIPLGGWGEGWSAGNILRFNSEAANVPLWIIQSIGQGDETDDDYTFCIEIRGDISAE